MLVVCLALLGMAPAPADVDRPVDFRAEIRPIFAASCTGCHGPERQEGDLRLDLKARALEGGLSGEAIVPGKAGESPILAHLAGADGKKAMPPKGPKLPGEKVDLIRRWIEQGAAWPDEDAAGKPVHWAYVPPARPEVPAVRDPAWVRNPIDAFVAQQRDAHNIAPAPEADRARWLRRVSLDLVGLPPTPEEVDAFEADARPDAYEKVVDRLLASPHYGERWARPWLDLARYADTHGFEKDPSRIMWPYRDWVIRAINDDLPFDKFTVEQVAGDLLPGATLDQKVASGFHRNTMINTEGGVDPEEARAAVLVDRVNTTASVWMGSTLACAQCHAHKFDPFTQKDYFRFYAYFDSAAGEEPTVDLAPPEVIARRDALKAQQEALEAEFKEYRKGDKARIAAWEAALTPARRDALSPEVRAALAIPAGDRELPARQAVAKAFFATDLAFQERQATLDAIKARLPEITQAMVMGEKTTPTETHIHLRGNFRAPGDVVMPGVPAVLPPADSADPANRLGLARWLVRPDHPLTARVAVNRIWEGYWGRGLVGTPEDFGTQGERPTHPELLDWLATELPRQGWSIKAIHRLIVLSATYRQSSKSDPAAIARDPDNRWLGRGPRLRVDAEGVRDIALSASGLLSPKVGGPSVFPPQPEGIWSMIYSSERWTTSTGPDRYRRGLYTFWRRTAPYPTFAAFDAPSRELSCVRRPRTNTPIQALATLNDPGFVEAARALARRMAAEAGSDPRARAGRGFRLCVARRPDAAEVDRIVALHAAELDHYRTDLDAAKALLADPAAQPVADADAPNLAAWTVVANVLLNLDETISKE